MPFYSRDIIIFVQVFFFNRVQMDQQNNMYNHKEKEDILLNIGKKILEPVYISKRIEYASLVLFIILTKHGL